MIPAEVVDEIRHRADIVEVIGGYLALKKAGSSYKAICPFHKEKSPSFSVSPDRQTFHCFGCGEGGNVFTFLMKFNNITFPQAAEELANRYGVTIPKREQDRKRVDELERLYLVMEEAANFFHQKLVGAKAGSLEKKYIEKRGIDASQVERFRLGWAPDSWDSLYNHLRSKKFSDSDIEKAGLIKKATTGNYIDRFRARLMFPIKSAGGRVIAFGGRIIKEDEKAAKYMNSPETPIYHKSSVLYGYHEGSKAARKAGRLVVVEGYMDTLALVKAGIENVCAVSGTALTEQHGEMIRRVCDKVTLLFDTDRAGEEAVKRSAPTLKSRELSVTVVSLFDAKDPDEFLAKHGALKLAEVIEDAPSFLRYVIDRIVSAYDVSKVDGRIEAVKRSMPYLANSVDSIEQSGYVEYLSAKTGVDISAIREELGKRSLESSLSFKESRNLKSEDAKQNAELTGRQKTERVLLAVMVAHPELFAKVAADMSEDDFSTSLHRSVYTLIRSSFDKGVTDTSAIISLATDDDTRNELVAITSAKSLFDEKEIEKSVSDKLKTLRYDLAEKKRAFAELKEAEKSGDPERKAEAQKKYLELVHLKL